MPNQAMAQQWRQEGADEEVEPTRGSYEIRGLPAAGLEPGAAEEPPEGAEEATRNARSTGRNEGCRGPRRRSGRSPARCRAWRRPPPRRPRRSRGDAVDRAVAGGPVGGHVVRGAVVAVQEGEVDHGRTADRASTTEPPTGRAGRRRGRRTPGSPARSTAALAREASFQPSRASFADHSVCADEQGHRGEREQDAAEREPDRGAAGVEGVRLVRGDPARASNVASGKPARDLARVEPLPEGGGDLAVGRLDREHVRRVDVVEGLAVSPARTSQVNSPTTCETWAGPSGTRGTVVAVDGAAGRPQREVGQPLDEVPVAGAVVLHEPAVARYGLNRKYSVHRKTGLRTGRTGP